MQVSRGVAIAVQYVLDEVIPPRLRDSKLLMYPLMRLILKAQAREFMSFKDYFFRASPQQIADLYARVEEVGSLQGESDLNKRSVQRIMELISGRDVLEVGCGRGYLAGVMATKHPVTASDIVLTDGVAERYPDVSFVVSDIENLHFADNAFETVVCTHTLEHTKNLHRAISELRRVGSKELIVVVPRQRPYKYTFSLHSHFFPYRWSLESAFGGRDSAQIERHGDWLYYERLDQER